MKILVIAVFAVLLMNASQTKDYVCLPCGQSCDHDIYHEPGTCKTCGMALVEKSSIRFRDISFDELCARLAANPKAVLLDVRSPGEFNGTNKEVPSYGYFKNAINVNVTELENRVGELAKYKDNEVLVYCSHSHRSPRASYFLSTHGFKNVSNMSGGVSTLGNQAGNDCLKKRFVAH